MEKNNIKQTNDIDYSFDKEGTNYPNEIAEKDIKDINLVNYWEEKIKSNDGLMVKDDIMYGLVHKSPKHKDGYQLTMFLDKELTRFAGDNQYSSSYAIAKSLDNYGYKLLGEYSLSKKGIELKKQDKNEKKSIKEIVNRAIKKAKEINKKIDKKEDRKHTHEI